MWITTLLEENDEYCNCYTELKNKKKSFVTNKNELFGIIKKENVTCGNSGKRGMLIL